MHRSYGLQGSLKRRYKHPSPTSINGYHTAKKLLSQSPAKRPTFAFADENGYTLAFANRIAHSGPHAETGAFRTGPLSLPSERSARSQTSPGRVSERQTLPLLGLGRVYARRTQKACGTAMRLCVSLSRRRRGPAGLRDLFYFCRNLWLYAPHSGLSMRARWGWYHYPRRALRTAEVLGVRLSKQLICRFLRLLSSILCAVPFSANMQISLSAISVANAFPPPTTAGLCASSRIASNRTTTVSLGCMDSSSFGCLIVLDSSSTYTTRS